MKASEIALIMMASFGGRMSPVLYAIPYKDVERFLSHPDTRGVTRGSQWALFFTTLDSYCEDVSGNLIYCRKDTNKQDELLNFLGIDKIPLSECAKIVERKLEYK